MKKPGEMAAFPRVFLFLFQPVDVSDIVHKTDWQHKFCLYISKNTQIYLSLLPIYN